MIGNYNCPCSWLGPCSCSYSYLFLPAGDCPCHCLVWVGKRERRAVRPMIYHALRSALLPAPLQLTVACRIAQKGLPVEMLLFKMLCKEDQHAQLHEEKHDCCTDAYAVSQQKHWSRMQHDPDTMQNWLVYGWQKIGSQVDTLGNTLSGLSISEPTLQHTHEQPVSSCCYNFEFTGPW